jgi:hypothetical protein
MRAWILVVCLLAGCSDPPSTPDERVEQEPDRESDDNSDSRIILDVQGETTQLDVLCTFGGGIEMQRAGGRVLDGTDHLEAIVAAPATSFGIQLGYVLTESPGYDELEQDGITWLPPVRDGERSFEISVPPEGIESRSGPLLWHFYQRVNVPVGELEQDCYTGVHHGDMKLYVEAVRA